MQVVSHPSALPAACIICPGSVRQRYIDTGLQFDWYGALYICDECILNMGRMIGMISSDQAEVLIGGNADLSTENFELRTNLARLSALEAGLNGLVSDGFLNRPASWDAPVLEHAPSDGGHLPEADGPSEGGAQGTEAVVGSGAGTPHEPSHDEGVGVVHADDGADAGRPFVI